MSIDNLCRILDCILPSSFDDGRRQRQRSLVDALLRLLRPFGAARATGLRSCKLLTTLGVELDEGLVVIRPARTFTLLHYVLINGLARRCVERRVVVTHHTVLRRAVEPILIGVAALIGSQPLSGITVVGSKVGPARLADIGVCVDIGSTPRETYASTSSDVRLEMK